MELIKFSPFKCRYDCFCGELSLFIHGDCFVVLRTSRNDALAKEIALSSCKLLAIKQKIQGLFLDIS